MRGTDLPCMMTLTSYMAPIGLFFALIGAVALFFADWQNWPVTWIAAVLLVTSGVVGFCINRWRFLISVFLTASLIGAEYASTHLRPYRTELSGFMPNIFILAAVSVIAAWTASLMGAGVRSFVDAGKQ